MSGDAPEESRLFSRIGVILAATTMILVPHLSGGDPYVTSIFISILFYFLLAALFDFMIGYLNIMNFGVAGFLGLGAYTSALFSLHMDLSPWTGLLLGGMTSALLGVIAGIVTLRLRGIYVGLATFFLAEIIRLTISSARDFTRGASGLTTDPYPEVLGLSFMRSNQLAYFDVLLVIGVVTMAVLFAITRSRIGLLFRAIRDDELGAEALGIRTVWIKLLNFSVASFFIGVIGAFYATYIGILTPSPREFGLVRTVEILTIAYIGGRGTLWGSLLGAFALVGMQEAFRFVEEWRMLLYGGFLVTVLLLFPRGFAGALTALDNRWGRHLLNKSVVQRTALNGKITK